MFSSVAGADTNWLTGSNTASFEEVAAVLTGELNERVRYEPASILGCLRHHKGRHLPLAMVAVQTVLHLDLAVDVRPEWTLSGGPLGSSESVDR